ncbi:DUF6328 family protein [Actinokineospora pegani]|uniref:DUF6328 family protein n=1 Tax=Actinokineospora pegani TaxID=2654637 RepID=UPI0012E9DC7D|nr:DUF6328 family protein [Actinokineospora pegani]
MNDDAESETAQERLNRNVNELLQELRVAQAGVQILFGFLLSITFTDVYQERTGAFERGTHLVAVLFAVAAVCLLTAPVAWHRLSFRCGQRPRIMRQANRTTVAGLTCLAGAIAAALLLISEMVLGGVWTFVVAGIPTVLIGVIWFAVPARWPRRRSTSAKVARTS